MENLTNEINKHFENEFAFLKLLEVVYDKGKNNCKIVFLFPQEIAEISDTQRTKLEEFLKEHLSLNALLELKFKKSYLDKVLVEKFVFNFFKQNNFSLFTSAKEEDMQIEYDLTEINVLFQFPKEICDYIESNNILQDLKAELEKNFISVFNLKVQESTNQIDESILEKREEKIPAFVQKKSTRYEVFEPSKLFGVEITPFPELIAEQKVEKSSLILAGIISNIIKKPFKSKHAKNPDDLSYYYTFDIKDETGSISAIHFSNKSNQSKLDSLAENMQLLLIGDLRKNSYGKLTYYIKAISHCIIKKEVIEQAKLESKKESFVLSDEYQLIFPKKFVDTHQENLFLVKKYTDLITNNTIVVFDVETTGFEPEFAEIIEIGAVKVVNGEIIETFQTLIKPVKEIPSLITDITGIDNSMVADSPSVTQALTDFILFAKDSVLSGYNVGFDMRFIQKAASNMGYHFTNKVEDAMAYARAKLVLGNYTLKNVSKNLNISLKEAHRALNDAIATARVLVELNKV